MKLRKISFSFRLSGKKIYFKLFDKINYRLSFLIFDAKIFPTVCLFFKFKKTFCNLINSLNTFFINM